MIVLLSKGSNKLSRHQPALVKSKKLTEKFRSSGKPPRLKLEQKAEGLLQQGWDISFIFLMTTPKTATSSHRLRSSVHRELSFLRRVLEGWFFCLCFTTEHFSKLCLPSPRSHSCSLSPLPFPVLLFPLSHFLPSCSPRSPSTCSPISSS